MSSDEIRFVWPTRRLLYLHENPALDKELTPSADSMRMWVDCISLGECRTSVSLFGKIETYAVDGKSTETPPLWEPLASGTPLRLQMEDRSMKGY